MTKRNTEVLTAEKDISVFKIVKIDEGKIVPYFTYGSNPYGDVIDGNYVRRQTYFKTYMEKPYNYYVDFIDSDSCMYEVNYGYHSYADSCNICVCVNEMKEIDEISGIMSSKKWKEVEIKYEDKYLGHYSSGLVNTSLVMRCVIPKGASYVVNESGEYVSNKLKVLSFEEI